MLETDVKAVARVEAAAAGFPWPPSQFSGSFTAGHDCRVLEVDNDIVAFAIFSRVLDEATLLNIAVLPTMQGRGYGRWLLEQSLAELLELGTAQCFLEVRASNTTAQTLYQSLGFITVGERKNYYPIVSGRENALVMRREMSNQPVAII
jgi:ribosomal-protein-alanine N-acetyltransferase